MIIGKWNSGTGLSGSFLLASGIIFFIFNTIAEGIHPSYNVGTNALSDLGALGSSTRFLWNGQLLVSGVLSLIGMYLLFFRSSWALNIGRRKIVCILYLLPPIGTITVSLFPENYILSIHTTAAFVVFIVGAISAIYAYRFTRRPFSYFSVLLGVISLISIPFLGLPNFGLVERLVVYPFVIWGIAFGSYLLALSPT
jgi:hypothetical membrane protein